MQGNKYERLHYLDSARGIAAMMVLCGHMINWKYADALKIQLASLVFNANDAVSFFFVLSGMVLTYPYFTSDKKLDIGKFYVSRFFRLYPGFLVALLLNALYASRTQLNASGLADLFLYNKHQFWEEAFLLKGFNKFYLPGWTLTIEMVYSLFMPFLVIIGRYQPKALIWLFLSSLLMVKTLNFFVIHFTLGAIISAYVQQIQSHRFHQTFWYRYRKWILPAAIVLFSLRVLHRISPFGSTFIYFTDTFLGFEFFVFTGIASAIFLVYILHFPKVQHFLSHPVLLFYGKISYGIYLMHWVVVWAVGDYWETHILPLFPGKYAALAVMLAACIALSTLMATGIHYGIERPFMKTGKRLAAKMKPTLNV